MTHQIFYKNCLLVEIKSNLQRTVLVLLLTLVGGDTCIHKHRNNVNDKINHVQY